MKYKIPEDFSDDIVKVKWEEGYAKFFVKDAVEYVSEAGNDCIKLTLSLSDVGGNHATSFVYLLEKALWIMKHFCDQTGLEEQFEKEDLEAYMCLNKEGICITKLIKNKPESRFDYSVKVTDFAKLDTQFEEFKDDDIPF